MQEGNSGDSAEPEICVHSIQKNDFSSSFRDLNDALSIIDSEIEKNPESWEALGAKADILCSIKLYSQAVQYCDLSLDLNPDNPLVLITKGDALINLGKHKEATSCYFRSMELEPLLTKECFIRGLTIEKPKSIDGQSSIDQDQLRLENFYSKSEIDRLRQDMAIIQDIMYLKDKEIDILRSKAVFTSNGDDKKRIQTNMGDCIRIIEKKDIMKSALMQ